MKKLYFSLLSLSALLTANAQFSITATNIPVVGDVNTYYNVDTLSVSGPGPAGASQTWNFSGVTSILPMGGRVFVAPSTTAYASTFTSSTVAQNDSGAYSFFQGTTNYAIDGLGSSTVGEVVLTDNGIIFNAFPFGMGASNYDTLSGTVTTISFGNGTVDGSVTTTVDGSGTLILPSGTFTNCIRVKMVTSLNISLLAGLFLINQDEVRYSWYNSTSKFPLFETGRTIISGQGDNAFASMNSSGFVGVPETANTINFATFPNPAKNEINIKMNIVKQSNISIDVINQLGQVVKSNKLENQNPGTLNKKIDLTGVASGIYFIKVGNGENTKVEKFIVE